MANKRQAKATTKKTVIEGIKLCLPSVFFHTTIPYIAYPLPPEVSEVCATALLHHTY